MCNGVTDDFREGMHPHLVQDARFVSADCLDAQVKLPSDVGDGFSLCQQVENLELTIG